MKRCLLSGSIAVLLAALPAVAWLRSDPAEPSFPVLPAIATPTDRLVIRVVLEHCARSVPLGLTPPLAPADGTLSKEALNALAQHLTVLVSARSSPPDLETPHGQDPEARAIRAMLARNSEAGRAPLGRLSLPPYLSFTRLDDGLQTGSTVVAALAFALPGYAADIAAVHVDVHHRRGLVDSGGGILFILHRRGGSWYVTRQEDTWIS